MITLSSLNELGAIIDKACDINNIEELSTIIKKHSEFTETIKKGDRQLLLSWQIKNKK